MFYHFRVHADKRGGHWAECIELEGCNAQGDTRDELRFNMVEALELHLSEPPDSNVVFIEPKKTVKGRNVELVRVPPTVAFAVRLRQLRKKRRLTQKQAATMLDMKNVFSYQKLENPKTANPELRMPERVKRAFPELRLDEVV